MKKTIKWKITHNHNYWANQKGDKTDKIIEMNSCKKYPNIYLYPWMNNN